MLLEDLNKQEKKLVLGVLKRAYNKIKNKRFWTTNELAKDKNNNWVDPRSKKAIKFCAIGAVCNVTRSSNLSYLTEGLLSDTITEEISLGYILPSDNTIANVNDHYGHKFIKDIYTKTIKKLKDSLKG